MERIGISNNLSEKFKVVDDGEGIVVISEFLASEALNV